MIHPVLHALVFAALAIVPFEACAVSPSPSQGEGRGEGGATNATDQSGATGGLAAKAQVQSTPASDAPAGAPAAQAKPDEPAASAPAAEERPAEPERRIPDWAIGARWYHLLVTGDDVLNWVESAHQTAGETEGGTAGSTPPDEPDKRAKRRGDRLNSVLPYLRELGVDVVYLSYNGDDIGEDARQRILNLRDPPEPGVRRRHPSSKDMEAMVVTFAEFSDAIHLRTAEFVRRASGAGLRVIVRGGGEDFPFDAPFDGTIEDSRLWRVTKWTNPDGNPETKDGVAGWLVQPPTDEEYAPTWKLWLQEVRRFESGALLVSTGPAERGACMGPTTGVHAVLNLETRDAALALLAPTKPGARLRTAADELVAAGSLGSYEAFLASPTPLSDVKSGRFLRAMMSPQKPPEGDEAPRSAETAASAAMRWRLATILQHFCGGAPMTYYGDEIGMTGAPEEPAEAPMWWKEPVDPEKAPKWYREDFASLIQFLHIRRDVDAPLRRGTLSVVQVDEDRKLLVLSRSLPGDEMLLVMNLGKDKQKLVLSRGKPGSVVGFLTPQLDPNEKVPARLRPKRDPTKLIQPLRVAGSRQLIGPDGQIPVWVDPMGARFVYLRDTPP